MDDTAQRRPYPDLGEPLRDAQVVEPRELDVVGLAGFYRSAHRCREPGQLVEERRFGDTRSVEPEAFENLLFGVVIFVEPRRADCLPWIASQRVRSAHQGVVPLLGRADLVFAVDKNVRHGLVIALIDAFKKEGWFESYDALGLTPHCGNLNMGVLIKGERAKLDELRRTDHFERFSMQLGRLFSGYGVIPGVTLEGMRKVADRVPDLPK